MVYLLTKQLKLPPAGSSRGQAHAGRSHGVMGHAAGLHPADGSRGEPPYNSSPGMLPSWSVPGHNESLAVLQGHYTHCNLQEATIWLSNIKSSGSCW
jgi:hypothetical protein